jgi:hypothetical protein
VSGGLGGKSTPGEREFLADMRNEARRLSPEAKRIRRAERAVARKYAAVLKPLVAAWDSIPDGDQVPSELNDGELWDAARALIGGKS